MQAAAYFLPSHSDVLGSLTAPALYCYATIYSHLAEGTIVSSSSRKLDLLSLYRTPSPAPRHQSHGPIVLSDKENYSFHAVKNSFVDSTKPEVEHPHYSLLLLIRHLCRECLIRLHLGPSRPTLPF